MKRTKDTVISTGTAALSHYHDETPRRTATDSHSRKRAHSPPQTPQSDEDDEPVPATRRRRKMARQQPVSDQEDTDRYDNDSESSADDEEVEEDQDIRQECLDLEQLRKGDSPVFTDEDEELVATGNDLEIGMTGQSSSFKTNHFNVSYENEIPYVEPIDAEENRQRFRAALLHLLSTMIGLATVEGFFQQDHVLWPFSATVVFFLCNIVRRQLERITDILFNGFSREAQEVLGRRNLDPKDVLSIPTKWSIAHMQSHWGIYLSIVELPQSFLRPLALWCVYVRSGTRDPDFEGFWARIKSYFGYKELGHKVKRGLHMSYALAEDAIQHIRPVALFSLD